MSGGATIQWVALILCVVFAAIRLPDALRGRGRGVFLVLVLFAVAVSLSIAPIYLFVDQLLGGVNVANLIIRLSLYSIVILLGMRCAAAFRSRRAQKFIAGPAGIAALALAVVVTVVLFVVSDLPESSTGLRGFTDQATVVWYQNMGRLYPAYVAACLLVPTAAEMGNRLSRPVHRLASGLIFAGFFMVLIFAILNLLPLSLGRAGVLLSFGSIVLVTTGLTMIWASRRRAAKETSRNFLARDQRRL
ncbi:hypothetical protein GCM10027403_36480 [Arthrobacter tecti]